MTEQGVSEGAQTLPVRSVERAVTAWRRMRGLLGRKTLPAGHGLLIVPCNAIHTLGMRFALDVRFYDKKGRLVREVLEVPPGRWWVWGGWRSRCVLECAARDPVFRDCAILPPSES